MALVSASSDGSIEEGAKHSLWSWLLIPGALVEEVASFDRPAEIPCDELGVGEVGYLVTGLKDPSKVKVGDTVTLVDGGCDEPSSRLS